MAVLGDRLNGVDPADWSSVRPHVERLLAIDLTRETTPGWLQEWSDLQSVGEHGFALAMRAANENTADAAAERTYLHYLETIRPQWEVAAQRLREKFLAVTDYQPAPDQEQFTRRFRNDTDLFRAENVSLLAELDVLANEYNKLVGAMTVTLDGEELTLPQAELWLLDPERSRRETAWRAIQQRWLRDRQALDDLFLQMLPLRRRLARNAGLPDYRAYIWRQYARFDYTPADCFAFHDAIECEVVPVAERLYQRRAGRLGVAALRDWDLAVDPEGRPPLRPFTTASELEVGAERVFTRVDPTLGREFARLRAGALDLASRPNKAPGGYCMDLPLDGHAYIFMNAVGSVDDVNTILHEGGHAFHYAETYAANRLIFNHVTPTEFAEVGSMAMELLAAPYLTRDRGGFYTDDEARRVRAEHRERIVHFLPYMAVVDAFQHWLYVDAPEAVTARDLDRAWGDRWSRFMQGVDWSGLEDERVTGWHRKVHLYGYPFYYIEYGIAQLGALQVWRNALDDQAGAVAAYRRALAAGGTRPLPDLFTLAGARLAFDQQMVGDLMRLLEAAS